MTERAPTRPLLRYHGGKWMIASWIEKHFPRHRVYVEPFGGGGSVLLRKKRSHVEIYNDLDGEIVNLFLAARDAGDDLRRRLELTPYARAEFNLSFESTEDPIERARRTVVRSLMGFGGNLTRANADGSPQRTGFRTYSKQDRGSIPAHDFMSYPDGLRLISARLRGVIIEQRPAVEVMEKHDSPETLHYVDPTYVHSERTNGVGGHHRGYRFEMGDDDHRELAACLRKLKGAVVLSGYPSALYDRELYPDWHRVERNALADGGRERTEVLWMRNINLGLFSL